MKLNAGIGGVSIQTPAVQMVLEGLTSCGHQEIFGFLTGLPCGECVESARKRMFG